MASAGLRYVPHVRDQHGRRHGRTRPEAAADAVLLWTLAVTVTLVVSALACQAALMLHVLLNLSVWCPCLNVGRHPGPGRTGLVEAGEASRMKDAHQASAQARPWGHGRNANGERSSRTETQPSRTISSVCSRYRKDVGNVTVSSAGRSARQTPALPGRTTAWPA
jgi:hypothetical protein